MQPIEEEALIRDVGESCKSADYFSKLFLKPIEITFGPNNTGLERVVRDEKCPDKFTTHAIQPLSDNAPINTESMKNQTLLSYFAAQSSSARTDNPNPVPPVKLAICVCAYSQDSSMLQKTLSGILSNYEAFEIAGICPEEIAVVFMFDGIEKLHESMQTFFTNMDRESRFLWKEYASTVQDLKDCILFDPDDLNIYSQEQLKELSAELLPAKKRQYARQMQLQRLLSELKSKKELQYSYLPKEAQEEYMNALRAEYKMQMGLDEDDKVEHLDDYYVRFFEGRPEIKDKCMYVAIAETERLCQRFRQSRSKTALLYSYRLVTKSGRSSYAFMCVKHRNQGKLWSHNWFFNGFCRLMQPPTSILLDVGLAPAPTSLYRMYNYLATHPDCGGVCGYMSLSIEKPEYVSLSDYDIFTRAGAFFFDVQKAQQFEYHYAHMLDKPFEAAAGFIHVLPGAFSGYNMKKLFAEDNPTFKEYFKSINEQANAQLPPIVAPKMNMLTRSLLPKCFHGDDNQAYNQLKQQNIYLAEDRILCLGIYQQGLKMAYLPEAEASVDSITTLEKLLGQRKRWINGSYFAFEKVRDSWKCGEAPCGFSLQLAFYVLTSYLSYISIALFFISLDLTLNTFADQVIMPSFMTLFKVSTPEELKEYNVLGIINAYGLPASVPVILDFVYLMLVGSMIILSLSLSQTNARFRKTYHLITGLLGWYSILMYVVLLIELFKGETFLQTSSQVAPISPTLLRILIFVIIVIHCIPPFIFLLMKRRLKYGWQVLSSSLSYLFYAPSYLHVLMTFAYCRVDDLSWGTKGLTTSSEHQLAQSWATEKHIFISRFVLANIICGVVLKLIVADIGPRSVVIFLLTLVIGLILIFKLVFAMGYLMKHGCRQRDPVPTKTQAYETSERVSRLEEVYKKYKPLLASNLKEEYRKYISHIGQSSIVPKGLKSMMFKAAKKSIQLSKIQKKDIPQNFKRPRRLEPLQESLEAKELRKEKKTDTSIFNIEQANIKTKMSKRSEEDSCTELKIKKQEENLDLLRKELGNKRDSARPTIHTSPQPDSLKNLLGKRTSLTSDEHTPIKTSEQKNPPKNQGESAPKFKKKYSKHEP